MMELRLSVSTLYNNLVCTAHNESTYLKWFSTNTRCAREALEGMLKRKMLSASEELIGSDLGRVNKDTGTWAEQAMLLGDVE